MPTKQTVEEAIEECRDIGFDAFLERYAKGHAPRTHYLQRGSEIFPLKAIWAAAHRPVVQPVTFNTHAARDGIKSLKKLRGLEIVILKGLALNTYLEGLRRYREVGVLSRCSALVAEAKKAYGYVCMVCDFDFEATYGNHGKGFVECHHIEPLGQQGGRATPKTIKDLAVVCSNCHRMIHYGPKALTLAELRALM